jgi:hypothetical protein
MSLIYPFINPFPRESKQGFCVPLQMVGILRGEGANRRVVLNYVYSGVEFVVILEKIKAEVKFSVQVNKIFLYKKSIEYE